MSEKTLRDEFAMAALGSIITSVQNVPQVYAEWSYKMADAMMAERVKHQAPAAEPDPRPANCKFRLMDEGKPYPKSGCDGCKINPAWCESARTFRPLHTFAHNRVTP